MGSVNPSARMKKVGQKGTSPISDQEENMEAALYKTMAKKKVSKKMSN